MEKLEPINYLNHRIFDEETASMWGLDYNQLKDHNAIPVTWKKEKDSDYYSLLYGDKQINISKDSDLYKDLMRSYIEKRRFKNHNYFFIELDNRYLDLHNEFIRHFLDKEESITDDEVCNLSEYFSEHTDWYKHCQDKPYLVVTYFRQTSKEYVISSDFESYNSKTYEVVYDLTGKRIDTVFGNYGLIGRLEQNWGGPWD